MELVDVQKSEDWDALIATLPAPHVLQTWEWGQVKAPLGWQPYPAIWRSPSGKILAAALILKRSLSLPFLPLRLAMLYIPRGPLLDWSDLSLARQVIGELESFAHQQQAVFLKIDPDVCVATGLPGSQDDTTFLPGQSLVDTLINRGWIFSTDQVQFRNTILIDLSPSEEELLSRMHQKARYNIRLAQRKGVTVRAAVLEDLPLLYKMYAETSVRDGFVIRDAAYYLNVWRSFIQERLAEALVAKYEGEIIAGLVIFRFRQRAWYLYGMSRDLHRDKMPNYLLQWQAMRRSKNAGCTVYDLWGAPDQFKDGDSMWGVYRFKEGLGGYIVRTPGAWDFPARPWLYRFYTSTFPHLLDLLRWRGKAKTRQEVTAV